MRQPLARDGPHGDSGARFKFFNSLPQPRELCAEGMVRRE